MVEKKNQAAPGGFTMPDPAALEQMKQQVASEMLSRIILQNPVYSDEAPFELEPDNGWLICERIAPEKTPGGIIIPDVARFAHYKVVAVGGGQFMQSGVRIEQTYKVGDIVLAHGQPIAEVYEGFTFYRILQLWVTCKVRSRERKSEERAA